MLILPSIKYMVFDDIVFLVQNCKSLKKINFKSMKLKKYALKWIYVTNTLIFGLAILPCVAVAEWFRASDHFRSFGQNLKWGPGAKIFFEKMIFDLSLILIFTLFFKPCVSFLLIYVAIFHKMAPLFSYEPTVSGFNVQ